MKVVLIFTSLEGGAGLCAQRIIRSTMALGIDVPKFRNKMQNST